MINKIEKLQQAVTTVQSNLDKLKAKQTAAENAVMDDPTSDGAALEAAKLSVQVRATEQGLTNAQEALTAEKKRLASPEAKAAKADLDKITKKGEALMVAIGKAAFEINDQFEALIALHSQGHDIAQPYGYENFKWMQKYLNGLRNDVLRFTRLRISYERQLEINAKGADKAKLYKSYKRDSAHKKMLKDRYPTKPGERR